MVHQPYRICPFHSPTRPFALPFVWATLTTEPLKVKVVQLCLTLCDPMDYKVHGILQNSPWNSSDHDTGVDNFSLLQGLFPTQGSIPGLQHYGSILYQLNHKGRPRILQWVAYPFSSRSSWPRNWTEVSWIAGRFFTNWASREFLTYSRCMPGHS